MIVNITMVGDKELIARLNEMPTAVHHALFVKITDLSLRLEKWVKTQKLDGQVLNRISGRLARSIMNKVTADAATIMARIFSSGDVKYAGIHEFGGTTSPHIIEPKKAAALAFAVGGKMVFARRVNHPGSKMPMRSFMRSSLQDMSTTISAEMKETVVKAAQKAVEG
jgi:phage gpG-like protein